MILKQTTCDSKWKILLVKCHKPQGSHKVSCGAHTRLPLTRATFLHPVTVAVSNIHHLTMNLLDFPVLNRNGCVQIQMM